MDLRFIFDLSLKNEEVLCFYRKDKSSAAIYRKLINEFCSQNLNVVSPDSISEYSGSANHYIDVKKYNISNYSQEDFVALLRKKGLTDVVLYAWQDNYDLAIGRKPKIGETVRTTSG